MTSAPLAHPWSLGEHGWPRPEERLPARAGHRPARPTNMKRNRDPKPTPPMPSSEGVPMSDSLRRLVARCEPQFFPANRVLIKEGDEGDSLFVVLAGRVLAYSTRTEAANTSESTKSRGRGGDTPEKGARRITYGEYLPGELLGEMSLDNGKRSATVKTMVPSWCWVLTRDDIIEHLSDEPKFAFELLKRVIRRARAATLSLRQIALNDAYGRVIHLLQSSATKRADGLKVLSISRERIAQMVGCTRARVSSIVKKLHQEGYIAFDDGQIVLMQELPPRF
jgi:CRP/FNR family transcriptional regulator, cyclic AMP receptor protein